MINYWISAIDNSIYEGDCRVGDIAATSAQVVAWQTANAPPVIITFRQFMALFTAAEQAAIVSSTDTKTRLFLLSASSGSVTLSDPLVMTDLTYLVSIGLLLVARVSQILTNTAPPA